MRIWEIEVSGNHLVRSLMLMRTLSYDDNRCQ
jgi:hypothetical protein